MADETPLEPTVKKLVVDRKTVLQSLIDAENTKQLEREEEAKAGREKIQKLTEEMAEIDAFLERH